jgi:hypothetical protein
MRRRLPQLALLVVLVPLEAGAAPQVSHHPLRWFVVKQAEAPGKDLAYYRQAIEQASAEADALLQGVQAPAPTDAPCCVEIEPLSVTEIDQSELASIDVMGDFTLMSVLCLSGSCGFLVDSITLCGGGAEAVGCSDFPFCDADPYPNPLVVAIAVEAVEGGYFGHVLAHEVGHTACLAHDSSDACNIMYPAVEPGTTQGCLTSADCDEYYQHGTLGPDTCECHTNDYAAVADGAVCTEGGDTGACASGLCVATPEPGAGVLALGSLAALGGLAHRRGWRLPGESC